MIYLDLVDMHDVGRAGVIDNIMRTQIRDAAFVIVDLGLGLPFMRRLVDLAKAPSIGFKELFCLVGPLVLLVGPLVLLVRPLALLVRPLLFLVSALALLVGQLLGCRHDLSLLRHPPQPALVSSEIESSRR